MRRELLAVVVLAMGPQVTVGQEAGHPYRVTWGDAASVGTAGVL